ncbi:MAG: hypothetical protein GEU99_18045 [Luteitalea sp.]|nr:hypothetical protein [Luteitalea sp.]
MSAFGGIYQFDETPLDRGWLLNLAFALVAQGLDGGDEIVSDSVAMVFRALTFDDISDREHQPMRDGRGRVVTFDGRLDNRHELLALVGDGLGADQSDAAIVLAMHRRFGPTFVGRLLGDFALCLWHGEARVLFLARDHMGVRPLYYHVTPRRVVWATTLAALLSRPDVPRDVNDDFVIRLLTFTQDPRDTPYRNIEAVRPGEAVTISAGHVERSVFWRPEPRPLLRYRSDGEYEEQFRHLFGDAVRTRLRSNRRVLAELSGGLDSSSIVCLADDLIARSTPVCRQVDTVSCIHDRSPNSDEQEWIRVVEQYRGRAGHHIRESEHPCLAAIDDRDRLAVAPVRCAAHSYRAALVEILRRCDARVLLSGEGGDQILQSTHNPQPELADLWAERRYCQLQARLRLWSARLQVPYAALLWRRLLKPSLPPWLREHLPADKPHLIAPWLSPALVGAARSHRTSGDRTRLLDGLPSQRGLAVSLTDTATAIALSSWEQDARVYVTYPYLHRPLLEFMMAVPFDQRLRPGESRSLMRRTLRSILPPPTLARRGKGDPSEVLLNAISREHGRLRRLCTGSRVAQRGYVNEPALLDALDKAAAGYVTNTSTLLNTIAIELWLRSMEALAAHGSWSSLPSRPAVETAVRCGATPSPLFQRVEGEITSSVPRR